jgi:DNA-binding MarR family transcriptional regulator
MNHPVRVRRRHKLGNVDVRRASEPLTTRFAERADASETDSQHDILLASVLQTGVQLQVSLDKSFLQHGLTMLDASIVLRCVESQVVLTPGKLAVALGRDKGTITRAVDRLERECFVTRIADKFDRRISLLKPTRRAKTLAPSLKTLFSSIRRQIFEEMNERDLEHLPRILARLRKNATNLGAGSANSLKPRSVTSGLARLMVIEA